jgi:hypothetical protein
MSARINVLTTAFLVVVALWLTATRYSSPSFYGSLGSVFAVLIFALVVAVIVLPSRGALPWREVALAVAALMLFEGVWRFYLSRTAWDGFKLTSIALDVGTPLIVALGVAALLTARRKIHRSA